MAREPLIRIVKSRTAAVLLAALCLFFGTLGSNAIAQEDNAARCEDFVKRLVADDYAPFFSLEPGIFFSTSSACFEALEDDPENPVLLVGRARAIDLDRWFTQGHAEYAVELLRKAAKQNYEPALVQLLRYRRNSESYHVDAFLNRITSIRFNLEDDLVPYVDALADSPSRRVQDLVLGTIVMEFMQERFDLARSLAVRGLQRNSAKAVYHYGMMHIGGMGVKRDKAKGFELLRKSARMGYQEAQVQFAFLKNGVYLGHERAEGDDFYIDLYKYLTVAASKKHQFATALLSKLITDLVYDTAAAEGDERALGLTLLEVIACNLDEDTKLRVGFSYLTPALPDVDAALPKCRTEAYRSVDP